MSSNPPRRRRLTTVREVCEEYLQRGMRPGQSEKFTHERRRVIGQFVAAKGDITIDNLIADDLERWIEDNPALQSGWTRLGWSTIIKRPFAWAYKKGLCDRHPFAGVAFEPGERMKPMSEEHFRILLRDTNPEFRRVLLFLWWTGARIGELVSLEWKFIDVEKGIAVLHKHKTANSRKDRAARIIYLPEKALRLLTWMLQDQRTEQTHVFLSNHGVPWTGGALALRFNRLRVRNGIPFDCKLYGARHAFGTRMAVAGVDLKTLSTLMGHTTTRMSEHYIHMAGETEHLHGALEKGLVHKKDKQQ